MSRTLDKLETITHGTPDGYRAGCTGSLCPAPVQCRDVHQRYAGDWSFRRRLDAGETAADIVAQEAAEADAVRERDKAARIEAKRAAAVKHQEKIDRARRQKKPKAEPRPPHLRTVDRLREPVTRLHAEGLTDGAIARELGETLAVIYGVRNRALGLPANSRAKTREPSARAKRRALVIELHGQGKTDREIAEVLGMTSQAANQLRRRLGLDVNREDRSRWRESIKNRRDRRPEVQALHAKGMTDAAIATELGMSKSRVGELRRDLGLPALRGGGSKWDGVELQGHGTNASYTRGCRCTDCHEAHKAYHREYRERRAQEGAGEHHGTAYGYQLGCRGSSCPVKPSCTQAMLDEDRARRRAAGVELREFIDAADARDHVETLHRAGMSYQSIAAAAGVPWSSVKALVFSRGEGRPPVSRMLPERAAAILAVRMPGEVAA